MKNGPKMPTMNNPIIYEICNRKGSEGDNGPK